jgi:hypothetical protein
MAVTPAKFLPDSGDHSLGRTQRGQSAQQPKRDLSTGTRRSKPSNSIGPPHDRCDDEDGGQEDVDAFVVAGVGASGVLGPVEEALDAVALFVGDGVIGVRVLARRFGRITGSQPRWSTIRAGSARLKRGRRAIGEVLR